MATKKNTDRFTLSPSGMKGIHRAPLRPQRQGKAGGGASKTRKGKTNGR